MSQESQQMYEAACGITDAVNRLDQILSVYIEVQGMIAENKQREVIGESMAYREGDFARAEERLIKTR